MSEAHLCLLYVTTLCRLNLSPVCQYSRSSFCSACIQHDSRNYLIVTPVVLHINCTNCITLAHSMEMLRTYSPAAQLYPRRYFDCLKISLDEINP
jgi:hypothetical protein